MGGKFAHKIVLHQDQCLSDGLLKSGEGVCDPIKHLRTFTVLGGKYIAWRKCPAGNEVWYASIKGSEKRE